MFQTAGVRSIRRVFSALSIVLWVALLGGCANPSPPVTEGVKTWTVENVASKSTAELYSEVIKPGVFERSSSKMIDGYTVESGILVMPDKSVGSLITARSADGSLIAAVEKSGENGWLVVNSRGESRFTPNPVQNYSLPDTLVEKSELVTAKPPVSAGPYVIDALVGFTRSAVEVGGGNATANGLVLVEGINLALRNSKVYDVSVRLVGVQVIEQNYPVIGDTLEKLPILFASGIQAFEPDIVVGIFGGHPDDTAVGYGYMPGRFAIGHNSVPVVRHEVGHNAGGFHCAKDGGGVVPYGYGYANGITFTAQCGNGSPYYSNPSVRDLFGLVIGDASTADMARVWRENADRLSSYAHFVLKPPTGFRVSTTSYGSISFAWDQDLRTVKYEIWGKDNILLPAKKYGEFTAGSGTIVNVPNGLRPYHLVAIYSEGVKSPNSNVVIAKPTER